MKLNLVKNICRLGAVGGLVATAYFSAKNGEEICERFEEVKLQAHAEDNKSSKISLIIKRTPYLAKPLIPTILAGAGTLTCMAVSERISYKQIAALTATCVYLTKNRNFLEGKLKEVVGEDTVKKIKEEFVKKQAPQDLTSVNFPCIEETGKGDMLCFEGYSGRWFRSSEEACLEAQEMLKKMYQDSIYCCMNDYYAALGISMTQFGHELGWVNSPDWMPPELHFTNTRLSAGEWGTEDGPNHGVKLNEPVFVLEIDTMPMYSWQEV